MPSHVLTLAKIVGSASARPVFLWPGNSSNLPLWCCRVTPQDGDASLSGADEPAGATGGAAAMAISASSTLSLPVSQGKPSLRRIKGRIHRSKSLDSIDLLDSSVRPRHFSNLCNIS